MYEANVTVSVKVLDENGVEMPDVKVTITNLVIGTVSIPDVELVESN